MTLHGVIKMALCPLHHCDVTFFYNFHSRRQVTISLHVYGTRHGNMHLMMRTSWLLRALLLILSYSICFFGCVWSFLRTYGKHTTHYCFAQWTNHIVFLIGISLSGICMERVWFLSTNRSHRHNNIDLTCLPFRQNIHMLMFSLPHLALSSVPYFFVSWTNPSISL